MNEEHLEHLRATLHALIERAPGRSRNEIFDALADGYVGRNARHFATQIQLPEDPEIFPDSG